MYNFNLEVFKIFSKVFENICIFRIIHISDKFSNQRFSLILKPTKREGQYGKISNTRTTEKTKTGF